MKRLEKLMGKTSQAYAKAAFHYAKSHNELDTWHDFILHLQGIKHPILKSPHLTADKLLAALTEHVSVSESQTAWIQLLVSHRHIQLLPRICAQFILHYQQEKQVRAIRVITARALSNDEKAKVFKAIPSANADIHFSVNPRIIGGVQIEHDGMLIDHSFANILNQLYRKQ